jgi:alanyl-tRNA synthetase
MLGNFSFGDYFKREAILWAWEFLTSKKWLGMDPAQLSVSVYLDDDEAAKVWHEEVGLPTSRIERMGEDDNFWPAGAPTNGPDGVCGPCSEIFAHSDRGGSVEIWNLVFTQFNRVGSPPNNLRPLPSKNIDTGMGLERAAAVLQNVDTNYHIDILRPIVEAAAEVCEVRYEPTTETGRRLRRITDHIRACTFAIHENVYPGPNKEKYVIRRLLRRAVLDGHQLGRREPFLHELVPVVVQMMRHPYPELQDTQARVAQVIRAEESAFFGTIDDALRRIGAIFQNMRDHGHLMVDGGVAAELYQTYGVPPELFESMSAEKGFTFDWEGFRDRMREHGERTKKGPGELFKTGPIENLKRVVNYTTFLGYQTTEAKVEIKGIVSGDELCESNAKTGSAHPLTVVLDRSPFYGESGGQVGDTGLIVGEGFRFRVTDTQRDGDLILHHGYLESGEITAGNAATAQVESSRRSGIQRAHSATHLLHHALRKTLGSHAQQQGSKVDDDWLRFDFTHQSPVAQGELQTIESEVNARVAEAAPVKWQTIPLREAREAGAMMLFGEKYPDPVRMVTMGEFSRELCGGTHLSNTNQVERFELVSEEGVSSGTRRIVAITGRKALENIEATRHALQAIGTTLGCSMADAPAAVVQLVQEVRDLKKQLSGGGKAGSAAAKPKATTNQQLEYPQIKAALRDVARMLNVPLFEAPQRVASLADERKKLQDQVRHLSESGGISADSLLKQAESIGDAQVVIAEVPGGNANLLRSLIDQLRKQSGSIATLLASITEDGKVLVVAGATSDLVKRGVGAVPALGLVVAREAQQRHQELPAGQVLPERVRLGTQAHAMEDLG